MKPSKDEKFQKEQVEIIDKLYNILELQDNTITLYELDTNKNKQQQIIDLFSDIKRYFSVSKTTAFMYPEKTKRLYLSIIKQILKRKYQIFSKEIRIEVNDEKIRTKCYTFIPL